MGQEYKVVNIDKEEWFSPRDFGNSARFDSVVEDGEGSMMGLATLIYDGRGQGSGDLYCYTCWGEPESPIAKRCESFSKKRDFKVVSKHTINGRICKTVVPKIAGRWAGDRIIITGDYADNGKYIDERDLTEEEFDRAKKEYPSKYEKGYSRTSDYNLYEFVEIKPFKNVSNEVIKALKIDETYEEKMIELEKKIKKSKKEEAKWEKIIATPPEERYIKAKS